MIKYPSGQGKGNNQVSNSHQTYQGKRGMSLEKMINLSNKYYLNSDLAVVHKKPTPVQIVKVNYPNRTHAKITEAYFRQPSTTDYNGVYNGYYLDFEAKETTKKTYLPLDNFHEHQVIHMDKCLKQKGICFVIVSFVRLDRFFFLSASFIVDYWQQKELNGRKSIPLEVFIKKGMEFSPTQLPLIPYLKFVEKVISK